MSQIVRHYQGTPDQAEAAANAIIRKVRTEVVPVVQEYALSRGTVSPDRAAEQFMALALQHMKQNTLNELAGLVLRYQSVNSEMARVSQEIAAMSRSWSQDYALMAEGYLNRIESALGTTVQSLNRVSDTSDRLAGVNEELIHTNRQLIAELQAARLKPAAIAPPPPPPREPQVIVVQPPSEAKKEVHHHTYDAGWFLFDSTLTFSTLFLIFVFLFAGVGLSSLRESPPPPPQFEVPSSQQIL